VNNDIPTLGRKKPNRSSINMYKAKPAKYVTVLATPPGANSKRIDCFFFSSFTTLEINQTVETTIVMMDNIFGKKSPPSEPNLKTRIF
jgi:hypothetical protein